MTDADREEAAVRDVFRYRVTWHLGPRRRDQPEMTFELLHPLTDRKDGDD